VKRNGENDLCKNIQTVLRRLRRLDVLFDDGDADVGPLNVNIKCSVRLVRGL
jgi:hypothetical protein